MTVIARLDRAIQYAALLELSRRLWNTGFPAFAGNDGLVGCDKIPTLQSSARRGFGNGHDA